MVAQCSLVQFSLLLLLLATSTISQEASKQASRASVLWAVRERSDAGRSLCRGNAAFEENRNRVANRHINGSFFNPIRSHSSSHRGLGL